LFYDLNDKDNEKYVKKYFKANCAFFV